MFSRSLLLSLALSLTYCLCQEYDDIFEDSSYEDTSMPTVISAMNIDDDTEIDDQYLNPSSEEFHETPEERNLQPASSLNGFQNDFTNRYDGGRALEEKPSDDKRKGNYQGKSSYEPLTRRRRQVCRVMDVLGKSYAPGKQLCKAACTVQFWKYKAGTCKNGKCVCIPWCSATATPPAKGGPRPKMLEKVTQPPGSMINWKLF